MQVIQYVNYMIDEHVKICTDFGTTSTKHFAAQRPFQTVVSMSSLAMAAPTLGGGLFLPFSNLCIIHRLHFIPTSFFKVFMARAFSKHLDQVFNGRVRDDHLPTFQSKVGKYQ